MICNKAKQRGTKRVGKILFFNFWTAEISICKDYNLRNIFEQIHQVVHTWLTQLEGMLIQIKSLRKSPKASSKAKCNANLPALSWPRVNDFQRNSQPNNPNMNLYVQRSSHINPSENLQELLGMPFRIPNDSKDQTISACSSASNQFRSSLQSPPAARGPAMLRQSHCAAGRGCWRSRSWARPRPLGMLHAWVSITYVIRLGFRGHKKGVCVYIYMYILVGLWSM